MGLGTGCINLWLAQLLHPLLRPLRPCCGQVHFSDRDREFFGFFYSVTNFQIGDDSFSQASFGYIYPFFKGDSVEIFPELAIDSSACLGWSFW